MSDPQPQRVTEGDHRALMSSAEFLHNFAMKDGLDATMSMRCDVSAAYNASVAVYKLLMEQA